MNLEKVLELLSKYGRVAARVAIDYLIIRYARAIWRNARLAYGILSHNPAILWVCNKVRDGYHTAMDELVLGAYIAGGLVFLGATIGAIAATHGGVPFGASESTHVCVFSIIGWALRAMGTLWATFWLMIVVLRATFLKWLLRLTARGLRKAVNLAVNGLLEPILADKFDAGEIIPEVEAKNILDQIRIIYIYVITFGTFSLVMPIEKVFWGFITLIPIGVTLMVIAWVPGVSTLKYATFFNVAAGVAILGVMLWYLPFTRAIVESKPVAAAWGSYQGSMDRILVEQRKEQDVYKKIEAVRRLMSASFEVQTPSFTNLTSEEYKQMLSLLGKEVIDRVANIRTLESKPALTVSERARLEFLKNSVNRSIQDPTAALPRLPECNDGIDNDGDGKADFGGVSNNKNKKVSNDKGENLSADLPADPGCTSPDDKSESGEPACSDGVDNDGDGKTDFPDDSGCKSRSDNNEGDKPECADGIDNDLDGRIDAKDPDCKVRGQYVPGRAERPPAPPIKAETTNAPPPAPSPQPTAKNEKGTLYRAFMNMK